MSRQVRFVAPGLLLVCLGVLAPAQQPGRPAPEELTGLKVGTPAPRFKLMDQEGKPRELGEFLGKGKVAIVFFRSADW